MASPPADKLSGNVAAVDGNASVGKELVPAVKFTPLSELAVGGEFSVKALICRSWDAKNPSGKYLGTEYVFSDDKGNAIHAIARSAIAHCVAPKLVVGEIYHIRRFTVAPNKNLYRLRNGDARLIHLESTSVIQKLECPAVGFTRHPFEVTRIEDIAYNGNHFLIDVVGRVFDLGVCKPTRNGSQHIDFQLINERGRFIKVSLWGAVAGSLSAKCCNKEDVYVVLLSAMNVREYRGNLQLSSTSGTVLFDKDEVPEIAELREAMCEAPVVLEETKGTLLQLLELGRQQHGDPDARSTALSCCVVVKAICPKSPWNYSSCREKGCRKGLIPVGTDLFCSSCEKICQFPLLRFRLRLEISDETTSLVVTLFDDIVEGMLNTTAVALLPQTQATDGDDGAEYPEEILKLVGAKFVFELKSHTYYNHGQFESFTVSRVVQAPSPQRSPIRADAGTLAAEAAHTAATEANFIDPGAILTICTRVPAGADVPPDSTNPLKRKMEDTSEEDP